MIVPVALIIIILVLLICDNVLQYEYYWKRRGVVVWKNSRIGGLFCFYLLGRKSMFEILDDMYKGIADAPAVAFNSLFTPSIFLKNLTNIHHVTTRDFNSFSHRGLAYREDDILANNVALLHGPKWKILRQAVSPLFTPAKLKKMQYIVNRCARDFIPLLKSNPDKLKGDAFSTMKSYCCAALTGAVFGMGTESPFQSPFLQMVNQALAPTFWRNFAFAMSGMSPELFNLLGLSLFSVQEEVFIDAIKQVIKERKESKDKKHDFIDLCVNLQNKGLLFDPDTGFELEPTDEVMAAQAYFFYMAGLDPSTAGLFATLFEVGRNPKIQKRLQQDIDAAFEKNNGEVTYDAVVEMKNLDRVIKEALRMYPPVGLLTRECVRDTKLPVGNIPIEKGTKVYTAIYSQHYDPKYFPDPMVFDPERFCNEQELAEFYIPFGQGNRICLGFKYVEIMIKTGIVHLLRHFDIESHLENGEVNFNKEYLFVRLKNVNFTMEMRKISY